MFRHRLAAFVTPLAIAVTASAVVGSTTSSADAAARPGATVSRLSSAAAVSYQRGPDPTIFSITATTGPYATAAIQVPDSASPAFGTATITYPTSTADGTFGAVAVAPGFFAQKDQTDWYGPRLASQGFVVITFNTNSLLDFPDARATALLAALDYLTTSSPVKNRIDPSRLAVMGHSMGGGGTLEASITRPSLKAAIGLAPFDNTKNFSTDRVPSLEFGGSNDIVASPKDHAIPFYTSIPATTPKAYVELRDADHQTPTKPNTTIAALSISWLKLYVDNDTRYRQFLCPALLQPLIPTISDYRNTCSA